MATALGPRTAGCPADRAVNASVRVCTDGECGHLFMPALSQFFKPLNCYSFCWEWQEKLFSLYSLLLGHVPICFKTGF